MVKIAVGQLCSSASLSHNLSMCLVLVQRAAEAKAKALFLPEAADYIASGPQESVFLAQPMDTSPFVLGLRKAAKEAALAINVGIHVPAKDGKIHNRSCWIDQSGHIVAFYDKLHLFDYGALEESNSVAAGNEIVPPVKTIVGRVGLTICFDLRFPEISLALKRQNAQIITFPSAFTVPTGEAHWEVLLRARAVETQTYVVAAAQVGSHNENRTSYGHSMVVDPWGRVLVNLAGRSSEPEIGIADINLDYEEKIRKEMPLQRRIDIYPEL